MTRISTRLVLAGSGLAIAGSLLIPGLASAQPANGSGLLDTTCTYAQIDAALRAQAPDAAAKLDGDANKQARLQELLSLPVDQRKAKAQEYLDAHPEARDKMQQKRNSPEFQQKKAAMQAVLDGCHNY
ncbi:hemophore-related protein [Nocardia sp. NPDC059240]|uniref:hemophore-related protein n=1 Tax=Nocardia sp. NPDC059240 TaxID=3346786 RepID=UPI0036A78A0E